MKQRYALYVFLYSYIKERDVITHPCLNFNSSLIKLPLKLDMDE